MEKNRRPKLKMTTIDKILLALAGFILGFTISMIVIFCIFQATPDVLIECVFSCTASELVISFVIWWIKKRYSNVRTIKEDKKNDGNNADSST